MKVFATVTLLLLICLSETQAQTEPDHLYLKIYEQWQATGTATGADSQRDMAAECIGIQNQLQQLEKQFPDWHPEVIAFHQEEVLKKLARIQSAAPDTLAPANGSTPVDPAVFSTGSSPAELDRLHLQLQAELLATEIWSAKVKSILASEPANPESTGQNDLEKARADIKNKILAAADVGQCKMPDISISFVTNRAVITTTNNAPMEATSLAEFFAKGNNPTITTRTKYVLDPDPRTMRQTGAELNSAIQKCREKIQLLRNELPLCQDAWQMADNARKLSEELKQKQAEVEALKSEAQANQIERMALQRKLQQVLASH